MSKPFVSLGISSELAGLIAKNGITEPTPIQSQSIPVIMAGKDIIAQAQTGTGKTLAFLLPMMEKIQKSDTTVQALIITPTRELALQITNEAEKLAVYKGLNILSVYGGQDIERQKRRLKGGIHIVIGTPGRILDHVKRRSVNFTHIQMLVLDEADQMLDMGFLRDVEQIINSCARHRQTVLCSATMPGAIAALSERYLHNPSRISTGGKSVTLDKIRQLAVECPEERKQQAFFDLLEEYKPFLAIIFCRTKRKAKILSKTMKERGFAADELHGNLTQAKREQVMRAFREMRTQFLVATDIAARGLDIEGITHVFNYDIPRDAETYIHRIGRTGRAGQDGFAITFISHGERSDMAAIERGIKSDIERRSMGKNSEREPREVKRTEPAAAYVPQAARFSEKKPYGSDSSSGRASRGSKKYAGDSRPSSPFRAGAHGRRNVSGDSSEKSNVSGRMFGGAERRIAAKRTYGSDSSSGRPARGFKKTGSDSRPASSFRSGTHTDRSESGENRERSYSPGRSFGGADRKPSSNKPEGRGGAFKRKKPGSPSSSFPKSDGFRGRSGDSAPKRFVEKKSSFSEPKHDFRGGGFRAKSASGGRKQNADKDFLPYDPRPARKKSSSGFKGKTGFGGQPSSSTSPKRTFAKKPFGKDRD